MRTTLDFLRLYFSSLILGAICVWIVTKFLKTPRFYWNVLRTLKRDLRFLYIISRIKWTLAKFARKNYTIFQAFDDTVVENPEKKCLYFEDYSLTRKQVQELSYQVSNFFLSKGFKKGDSVGIFMENCAEYVALWLGLTRIGVVPALINYNLRQTPLKHCIDTVQCKAVVFSPALAEAVSELVEVSGQDTSSLTLYCFTEGSSTSFPCQALNNPARPASAENLNLLLARSLATPPHCQEKIGFRDKALYMFTSGTSGFPKSVIILHARLFNVGVKFYHYEKIRKDDVIYSPLPLYHGQGTKTGTCVSLIYGPSQVIRKQFSASAFWKDCIKHNVTVAQYIGETCRYILAQPETELDKQHSVRVIYGSGLNVEVWGLLKKRFGFKHIGETYGSTEGPCGLGNISGKIGAVGHLPLWLPNALPFRLIKVDVETGEAIRDPKSGFVKICDRNEPGEAISAIVKDSSIAVFAGYTDESATKEKVLTDVFELGDAWFRSGDLLVQDELGYFYFLDRIGDTFRWKGENCSTAEVESVLKSETGLEGIAVFGVKIPKREGRAGMAVISDPGNTINFNKLAVGMVANLPAYARPLFVKLLDAELEITGTYKLRKADYQREGYENYREERIYFFRGTSFERLNETLYNEIVEGKIHF